MRPFPRHLPIVGAAALFAIVVADARAEFQLVGAVLSWLLTGAALGLARALFKARGLPYRGTLVLLTLGALGALLVRNVGYEPLARQTNAEWQSTQALENERLAARTASEFAELVSASRRAAQQLARSTPVAVATEGSDAQDYLSGAFEALESFSYPRAHPDGVSGATLYDTWRRPLAWSGNNVSLYGAFEQPFGTPDSTVFIHEHGVHTYLVAIEPLVSRLGFVSVEVPLISRRRLDNRYLEDYDAFSAWLSRTAETELLQLGEAPQPLEALFERHGESFWDTSEGHRRLYFALRSEDGALLGMTSIAGEPPASARRRSRMEHRTASGVVLFVAVIGGLIVTSQGRFSKLGLLVLAWTARLVAFWTELPLSLGVDLDNPTHYASALFGGLDRSPADLFLTAAALLVSAIVVWEPIRRWTPPRAPGLHWAVLSSVVALAILVGINIIIADAWSNSNLALASVSSFPLDYPRLAVQLGLVMLFLASCICAAGALSLVSTVRPEVAVVTDVVVIAGAFWLLSSFGLADPLLFALPPFAVVRALALSRDELSDQWASAGIYAKLASVLFLGLAAVTSFYPALARFEATTIRAFVANTVAPAVLQHGQSTLDTLNDTARTIDVMEAEGRLDAIDREDIAYRIWVGTELVSSSLSSSIEVVDEDGRTVSKFSLSLPTIDEEVARPRPPREWIVEEGTSTEPNHPGFVLARRHTAGPAGEPWEIRVRLAADWRNLPFVSTTNPYLHLFRLAGNDVPSRFRHRTLALFVLALDGSPVYQSSGGAIRLDESDQRDARRAPLWRDYSVSGQTQRAYVFSDGIHTFALTYPKTSFLSYAAEAAGWAVLTALSSLVVLLLFLVTGASGSASGVSTEALAAGIGGSFSRKLYVAFVLIALVPIASLAIVIRGIVLQQLQNEVERDGMARAQVVERLVRAHAAERPARAPGARLPSVSDAVLESVGSLAGVDVDLYSGGELVATSKRELVASGLLRARIVPSVYRDLILGSRTESIHREAVGSFEYLVVSAPIRLGPSPEPTILALPLASQRDEIDERVASLNQTLLLAALGFSLAAAALAYSLARRISGPIHTLTQATHRVASGDLDVSLQTTSQDEIGGLFASFTRMTSDLKQQRLDLEHKKKLEAWAEMARQVAHEVKNPLTPIQLSTEHMLRVYEDPDVDFSRVLGECSETILQQVKTLRQISMEFSTFASPEPLKLDETDVGELVREIVTPYVQSPPDGVDVDMTIASDLPALDADARLLKRTVHNLVENALHALNGGGRVTVDVGLGRVNGSRSVDVAVEDTGVGVDPELKDRIFEPYFSTRAAGTGLGLAIAKKVVEDHGGSISLNSELGKGTRVEMRLPVSERAKTAS